MKQTPNEKCENCRLWFDGGMIMSRYCKRNAPSGGGWTNTTANDWCGEFERRIDEGEE